MSTAEIGVAIAGAALVLGMLVFAQRLGAWESKHLARLVVILAGMLGIAWLLYFVPKPWAWIVSMAVIGLVVWPSQRWLEEYRGRNKKPLPLDAAEGSAAATHHEARADMFRTQAENSAKEVERLRSEIDRLNQHRIDLLGTLAQTREEAKIDPLPNSRKVDSSLS